MTLTKTSIRTLAVTALVTPALFLGPAAGADSVAHKDPKGDSPKSIDIVRWKANNGKKAVTFTLRFRSLKLRKLQGFGGLVRPKGTSEDYAIAFRRAKAGAKLKPAAAHGDDRITCKRTRFKRRGDVLRLRVPQKCFGKDAGALRLGVIAVSLDNKLEDSEKLSKFVKRG
ncbi:MAG: hypothetical protein ACRDO7_14700 [Nocardioidaceae bacterium]